MPKEIGMVRPSWDHRNKFLENAGAMDVTVLICQRKTKHLTQLCLESLLRFYPDIPVLVADGNSKDDSADYVHWVASQNPNVMVWDLDPNGDHANSHGVTMDKAIRQFITTRYVLLMDSDIISERGCYIEQMLDEFERDANLYAIGTLMITSRKNQACGWPQEDSDILPYAHPSCSMYDRARYLELPPFVDHGAPCCYNNIGAVDKGLKIAYFPIDQYVSHLSGASWTNPRTIWPDDHDVKLRPFVTFVTSDPNIVLSLAQQIDRDFDVVVPGPATDHSVVVHWDPPVQLHNSLYDVRFAVQGEWVCTPKTWLDTNLIGRLKRAAVANPKDEIVVGGERFIRRRKWQRVECLKN